jgi:hypothetical protein
MAMTFSKEEILESNVSGQTIKNPKNNRVTDIALSDLKKKFVEKMFFLHISKDHMNLGWHKTRLKIFQEFKEFQNTKLAKGREKIFVC